MLKVLLVIKMNRRLLNKKGFSLIEVILAISIFALSVTGLLGGVLYGQYAGVIASHRGQAALLATEGIEATQHIAAENFSNLTDGLFGLDSSTLSYTLIQNPDVWDIYERSIAISSIDANTKYIESTVSWSQSGIDRGEVLITSYITNWK